MLQWWKVPILTVYSTKQHSSTWAAARCPLVPAGSWTQPFSAPAQGCLPSLATSSTPALRWCDPLRGMRPFQHSANYVSNGTFIDHRHGKSLLSYRYQMPHLVSQVARCHVGTEGSGLLHERISSLKDSQPTLLLGLWNWAARGSSNGDKESEGTACVIGQKVPAAALL